MPSTKTLFPWAGEKTCLLARTLPQIDPLCEAWWRSKLDRRTNYVSGASILRSWSRCSGFVFFVTCIAKAKINHAGQASIFAIRTIFICPGRFHYFALVIDRPNTRPNHIELLRELRPLIEGCVLCERLSNQHISNFNLFLKPNYLSAFPPSLHQLLRERSGKKFAVVCEVLARRFAVVQPDPKGRVIPSLVPEDLVHPAGEFARADEAGPHSDPPGFTLAALTFG